MKKILFVASFLLLIVGFFTLPVSANDRDTLVRFKGGIGVIPVSSGVLPTGAPPTTPTAESVNRNFVRGVQPAGQIWVIKDLDARVKTNGHIKVRGKGLIFGGGNNAGRATGQFVFATLICDVPETTPPTPPTPFTPHSTTLTGVRLADNGDFRIDDVLSPALPVVCDRPMLLIRTAGSGNWFAVGILDD